jgi:hypothetical protein
MTSSKPGATQVVVVDGSNIATEGRSTPSLSQLNDAVNAFIDEFPDTTVTVVVDATFGHRIDKREAAEFEEAVANNELVAPPAGAIGRGDAFVLNIANKVRARILSNDSFQEFHGEYPWLFDEGRLIGGKPVPHVGWVFVERLPVKGPVSRKAQRAAKVTKNATAVPARTRRVASAEASQPMPVPTTPPPGGRRRAASGEVLSVSPEAVAAEAVAAASPSVAAAGPAVNDLLTFLEFVEHHPIGSSVNGVVESYSSHGAYVTVGNVRGYVPLRLMAVPPPRSAREVMRVGDAVTLVVTSFAPARRSVDLAVPEMAPMAPLEEVPAEEELVAPPAKAAAGKKAATKKAAAKKAAPRKAETKKVAAKKRAEAAPTKMSAPRKAAAKKTAARTSTADVEVVPEPTEPAAAPQVEVAAAASETPPRRRKRTAAAATDSPAATPDVTPSGSSAATKDAARRAAGKKAAADAESARAKRTVKKVAEQATSRRGRRRSATAEREEAAG